MPLMPWVGRQLGKYLLTGELGRGGMGVVYEARDTLLERCVAIKLLPESVAEDADALRRFLREAQSAAKLNHPNVVTIYDIEHREGVHYIVMELVRGRSAQEHLDLRGAFPWQEATRIAAAVCRGLAAAHQVGIIHRDIKPANIMRAKNGEVKLSDFGLARPADQSVSSRTAAGKVAGTPWYMSPEQCRSEPLDERTDLYSLGAAYFTLLTGRPPFVADQAVQVMFAHCTSPIPDPRDLNPAVPELCSEIVAKAMAKSTADRFQSASEMLAALKALLMTSGVAPVAPAIQLHGIGWQVAGNLGETRVAENVTPAMQTPARASEEAVLAEPSIPQFSVSSPARRPAKPLSQRLVLPQRRWWLALAAVLAVVVALILAQVSKHLRSDSALDTAAETRSPNPAALHTMTPFATIDAGGEVQAMALSSDNRWLAWGAGQDARQLSLRDLSGVVSERHMPLQGRISAIAISWQGNRLAVASETSIRLWSLPDFREGEAIPVSNGNVRGLAFAGDGELLAVGIENWGSTTETLQVWNLQPRKKLLADSSEAGVYCVAFSPDSRILACGTRDGDLRLVTTENWTIGAPASAGTGPVYAVTYSPNGSLLATAATRQPSWLTVWEVNPLRQKLRFTLPAGEFFSAAFSPDGRTIAASSNGRVKFWDVASGIERPELLAHQGNLIRGIAFSSNSPLMITASFDKTLQTFDVSQQLGQ